MPMVKLFSKPPTPWREILGRHFIALNRSEGERVYVGDGGVVLRTTRSLDSYMGRNETVEGEDGAGLVSVPAAAIRVTLPPWADDAKPPLVEVAPLAAPTPEPIPEAAAGDMPALQAALDIYAARVAPWWKGTIALVGPPVEPDVAPPTPPSGPADPTSAPDAQGA